MRKSTVGTSVQHTSIYLEGGVFPLGTENQDGEKEANKSTQNCIISIYFKTDNSGLSSPVGYLLKTKIIAKNSLHCLH